MTYNYDECMQIVLVNVKRYRTLREKDPDNKKDLQSIRDTLSEALLFFGPVYAELRIAAANAELNRKLKMNERKKFWKKEFAGTRGHAEDIETNTFADCEDVLREEMKANEDYYKAKSLIERVDQELNSISSRLKILIKND